MSTQITQENNDVENGNTNSFSTSARYRNWCFTLNNPTEEEEFSLKVFLEKAAKYVYQLEEGENKTPHLQGYFELKNNSTFSAVKNKIGERFHLEICRNKDASIKYCQKAEGRLKEPVVKGFPRPLKIIQTLRNWQQEIVDIIDKEADDRTIHWIWESTGGTGKTALCKYICVNYNAVYCNGKSSDINYMLKCLFEEDESKKDDLICIFDFTRSLENYVSYQAIESVKNGIIFSGKYESAQLLFNAPHVLCFANFPPDTEKLSADRWKIKKIDI